MADNPFTQFATEKPAAAPDDNPFRQYSVTGTAQKPPPMGVSEDMLRSAVSGIPKGAANVIGSYGDLMNLASRYVAYPMAKFLKETFDGGKAPEYDAADEYKVTSESVRGAIEDLAGKKLHQPQTAPGRYAGAVTEGLMSGGRMGALAMTGGEAGADLTQSSTLGRLAGTIATPVLYAAGRRMATTNAPRMIAERTKDLSPDDFALARERVATAKAQGIPLSPAEALDSPQLQQLASDTAAMSAGRGKMQTFAQDRVPAIAAAVERQIDQIAPVINSLDEARLKIGNAAEAAKETVRKQVNAEVRPGYQALESGYLDDLQLGELKRDPVIAQAFEDVRSTPAFKRLIGDLPDNSFVVIDQVKKRLDDLVETLRAGAKRFEAKGVEGARAELLDAADTALPGYPAARKSFQERVGRIDAIAEGATGRVDNANRIQSMTAAISNPKEVKPADLARTAEALTKEDPQAFTTLLRIYFDNSLNTAQERLRGGGTNPYTGANFYKAIAGTPDQKKLLDAMLDGAAKANGANPAQLKAGWQRLLTTLDLTDRIPGMGSPTAGREAVKSEASQSTVAGTFQVLTGLRTWWREVTQRKSFAELADIFTNPDAVDKIQQLSKLAPDSQAARLLAAEIVGVNRALAPAEGQGR